MRTRTFARKKTASTNFAQPSLISSTKPTLANPVRGFGIANDNVIQKAADTSTEQQEIQTTESDSLEQLNIQEKPIGHDISKISFRRPQAKLTVGEPGDKYEQEADRVASRIITMPASIVQPGGSFLSTREATSDTGNIQNIISENTLPLIQRDENPQSPESSEDIEEVNCVVYFANGDAYGRAARTFIQANYPNNRSFSANSLEQMFNQLHRAFSGDNEQNIHIGEIILISHAVLAPPTSEEEEVGNPNTGESVTTQGALLISPVSGSEERVTAETLHNLQTDFRRGIHRRFRRRREEVISNLIDENTMIEIRACRIGQDRQTMEALRSFFGGQAQVRAPQGYQGYAEIALDGENLTLEEAVEILIEQGSAPTSLRQETPEQQRSFVENMVTSDGGLPTQHFVMDENHEAFSALSEEEQIAHISQPEQSEGESRFHTRQQVAGPGLQGGFWSYALDPSGYYEQTGSQVMRSDPELDQLSRQELEQRAQQLSNPYRPENAPMLLHLRRAWEFVSLGDDLDNPDDPIAGLPPVEIFGNPGVVEADAAQVRRGEDTFRQQDIDFIPPTSRQRAVLAGEPDSATPEEETDQILDENSQTIGTPSLEARTGRSTRSRRSRSRRARTDSISSPEVGEQSEELRLIAKDGLWLVFNRPAFRQEVVQYIWGNQFSPTITELHPRTGLTRTEEGIELDLGDTHWQLAQTGFAARPELYQRMRPHIREQMEELTDQSLTRQPEPPSWIPQDVWQEFLNSNDGIHTYPERSPLRTNIILINRGSIIGGYADSITDDTLLRRLMQVKAPSVFERIAGLETGEQALVRWMAEENQYYNDFMLEQVQSGIGVREARIRYESRIRDRFINTFLESYMSLIPANTGSRVVDTVVSFLTHPWNPILESLEVD